MIESVPLLSLMFLLETLTQSYDDVSLNPRNIILASGIPNCFSNLHKNTSHPTLVSNDRKMPEGFKDLYIQLGKRRFPFE